MGWILECLEWPDPRRIQSHRKVKAASGNNAIVVSHGMTITTLIYLIDPKAVEELVLDNGSVTVLAYEDGALSIEKDWGYVLS